MPAPGAKCPDCILAARRERERPAAPAPATPTPSPAYAPAAAAVAPQIAERDRAILDRLKAGPASFEQLMDALPGEFESKWVREKACRSAVLRMKTKGQLKIVPEGYAAA
jgi:hypothetical protein